MKVEVPLGDVVDRVTILLLKAAHIADEAAVAHVNHERAALETAWAEAGLPDLRSLPEWAALSAVNGQLWQVEDTLRDHERRGDFGEDFVSHARSVYQLNDQRAALKRLINTSLGSEFVEEKSYTPYDAGPPLQGETP